MEVVMNRKGNRKLKKEQNFIKKLCSIIIKHLSELLIMFDNLTDTFNKDNCIKNISKTCNQDSKGLPYWENIQDVFISITTNELRDIQKYTVKANPF